LILDLDADASLRAQRSCATERRSGEGDIEHVRIPPRRATPARARVPAGDLDGRVAVRADCGAGSRPIREPVARAQLVSGPVAGSLGRAVAISGRQPGTLAGRQPGTI
jgi:hypothetical protein